VASILREIARLLGEIAWWSVFLVAASAALAFLVAALVFRMREELRAAAAEDARWPEACAELGAAAVEISALDTRLIRPWGPSAANEIFVVRARGHGHGWLEPITERFQEDAPLSIRAVAGEVGGGTKVAFVIARTRARGLLGVRVALCPSGPVFEPAPTTASPPVGFVRDLEALAARARVRS
jgi:hypothetical protein